MTPEEYRAAHAEAIRLLSDAIFRRDDALAPPGVLPPADPFFDLDLSEDDSIEIEEPPHDLLPLTALTPQATDTAEEGPRDEAAAVRLREWEAFLDVYATDIFQGPPVSPNTPILWPPPNAAPSAPSATSIPTEPAHACVVCEGSGRLLQEACPLCGGCVDADGNVLDPTAATLPPPGRLLHSDPDRFQ